MSANAPGFGRMLREWRRRRRLSQLDLAAEAEVSQRHLSFVETGRAAPSRGLVIRLAERLGAPPRERNALLLAAGYAPDHPERPLDHPDLAPALRAVETLLAAHEPYPALAVDRRWSIVRANGAVGRLLAGVSPALTRTPANALRISLHPEGLAPRIANFREWRAHLLGRVGREIEATGDPDLAALRDELHAYPVPPGARPWRRGEGPSLGGLAAPFQLETPGGRLSFLSATTVFGTAVDVTLAELAIETFLPADAATAAALARLAADGGEPS